MINFCFTKVRSRHVCEVLWSCLFICLFIIIIIIYIPSSEPLLWFVLAKWRHADLADANCARKYDARPAKDGRRMLTRKTML